MGFGDESPGNVLEGKAQKIGMSLKYCALYCKEKYTSSGVEPSGHYHAKFIYAKKKEGATGGIIFLTWERGGNSFLHC